MTCTPSGLTPLSQAHRSLVVTQSPDDLRSFTTFVLPFWYELTPRDAPHRRGETYYEAIEAGSMLDPAKRRWDARRRYFTPETTRPLYTHARWFQLADPGKNGDREDPWWRTVHWGQPLPGQVPTAPQDPTYCRRVRFTAPEVVLFEFPGHRIGQKRPRTARRSEHDELMEIGFLLLTACLQTPEALPDRSPRLADLLEFNEVFRYLRADHDGWLAEGTPAAQILRDVPAAPADLGTVWEQLTREPYRPGDDITEYDRRMGHDLFSGWRWLLDRPLKVGDRSFTLVPDTDRNGWHRRAWRLLASGLAEDDTKRDDWMVYGDHRAFVWTAALLDSEAGNPPAMAQWDSTDATPPEWVRLLNVDGHTQAPSAFERAWASERTYRRWASVGTLYGFCGHAGAVLVERGDTCPSYIPHVFRTVYLDLALVLLFDRTVAFAISNRLAELARNRRERAGSSPQDIRIDNQLRGVLEYFTNVYRYPLLSNQQQAIEMYGLARKAMDVDDVVREIERQLESTDLMLGGQRQIRLAEAANLLTVTAAVIAASGFAWQLLSLEPVIQWAGRGGVPCAFGAGVCRGINYVGLFIVITMIVLLSLLALTTLVMRLYERLQRRYSGRPVSGSAGEARSHSGKSSLP